MSGGLGSGPPEIECLKVEQQVLTVGVVLVSLSDKYVVKHKSAKLFMTYAVGKLEAAHNISHLILSTSSQRVSKIELVS